MKANFDPLIYFLIPILVFGIIGNFLVVTSILRQKSLLKNNYYFLVLHLAICDLGWLVLNFLDSVVISLFEKLHFIRDNIAFCFIFRTTFLFQVAGIYIMLVISAQRYRATVQPLKPATSRQKLKTVCSLGYTIAFFAGYGIVAATCFKQIDVEEYWRFLYAYGTFFFYLTPTIFMAVVYYKIGQALVTQSKSMKIVRSIRVPESPSSFKILRYIRHRRAYAVCLATVLCYGVGNLPVSVWFVWYITKIDPLADKFGAFYNVSLLLRIAGSCSVNPLIYGILDKRLITFWKIFCKKNRTTQRISYAASRSTEAHS